MLVNNSNITVFQKETAAAVYSAFGTIAIAIVFILSPAAIGIFGRVRKIDMTFWQPVRIRHIYTRRSGKQNMQVARNNGPGRNSCIYNLIRFSKS